MVLAVDVFCADVKFVILGQGPFPIDLAGVFNKVEIKPVVNPGVGYRHIEHIGIGGQ